MANIEMRPDNIETNLWWAFWVERDEIVARIEWDLRGIYKVIPQGPHWSPMKSVGCAFDSPSSAPELFLHNPGEESSYRMGLPPRGLRNRCNCSAVLRPEQTNHAVVLGCPSI